MCACSLESQLYPGLEVIVLLYSALVRSGVQGATSPMKFSVDKCSILHLRWTRTLHRLIRHGWLGNSSAGKGMQGLVLG